jgi:hypothetical protein
MSAIQHPEARAGDNIDGRIINIAWPVPLALQLFDARVGAALRCGQRSVVTWTFSMFCFVYADTIYADDVCDNVHRCVRMFTAVVQLCRRMSRRSESSATLSLQSALDERWSPY